MYHPELFSPYMVQVRAQLGPSDTSLHLLTTNPHIELQDPQGHPLDPANLVQRFMEGDGLSVQDLGEP